MPDSKYIGARIRQRRTELGVTQERLGEIIGVTYQQIQKYERGRNKLNAERLYRVAEALKVDVSFFFGGAGEERAGPGRGALCGIDPTLGRCDLSIHEIEVIQCLRSIRDPELRDNIIGLLRSVCKDFYNKE